MEERGLQDLVGVSGNRVRMLEPPENLRVRGKVGRRDKAEARPPARLRAVGAPYGYGRYPGSIRCRRISRVVTVSPTIRGHDDVWRTWMMTISRYYIVTRLS